MCDDPTSALQLYEAASRAIEAADPEYEIDDHGSHELVRVQVDDWLALQRATLGCEPNRGMTITAESHVVVKPPVEDPFRRKEEE